MATKKKIDRFIRIIVSLRPPHSGTETLMRTLIESRGVEGGEH